MNQMEIKPTLQSLIQMMEEHAVQVAQEILDEERQNPITTNAKIDLLVEKMGEIIAIMKAYAQDKKTMTAPMPMKHEPYQPATYEAKINRDGGGVMQSVTLTPKE